MRVKLLRNIHRTLASRAGSPINVSITPLVAWCLLAPVPSAMSQGIDSSTRPDLTNTSAVALGDARERQNRVQGDQSPAEGNDNSAPNTAAGAEVSNGRRGALEEVIVTAQKREERTIDVPMSITAISGDRLIEEGVRNTLDLSQSVPGLAVSETGPGRQAIIVRGIFSQRGTSSLTGVYLDEMPLSGVQDGGIPSYPDLRTIDLERIEVLKGPQGTLFGEGAAGGVVRFITKSPDLSNFGGEVSAEVSDTTDGGWSSEVRGVVNMPIAEQRFGVRLAGSYENRSGWIDQPSIGRENINDADVKHGRAKAVYTPLPGLEFIGLIEVHRDKGGASNIVNQTPLEDSNFRQAFDLYAPTDYTNDYDLYNLTVTYNLGFAKLLSSTSYAELETNQNFTQLLEGSPNPWLEIYQPLIRNTSITSQEIRLTSTGGGRANWTLGAAYKDSELISKISERGADARLLGGAISFAGLSAGQKDVGKSESWAAFGDASFDLLKNFEVGGGLRYFSDEREALSQASATAPLLNGGSGTFNKLTYRVYGKYQFTSSTNMYASVATGFRSGGFNTPAVIARGAPPAVGEENTKFYEIGVKSALLDGRLRVDAAVYYGEFSDMQEQYFTISPVDGAPLFYTINGQDAELQGFEADIAWAVTDQLTLSLAGGKIDSEITEIKPGVRTIYQLGDPINQVPDYNLSMTADYRFSWSTLVPGSAMISYSRQGQSFDTNRNSAFVLVPQTEVPEKDFVNVSLGGEWRGWNLNLFGRNLLNESDLLFPTSNGWSSQARPRSFGVLIGKSFQ